MDTTERFLLDWKDRGSYSGDSGQEDLGECCDWARRGVTQHCRGRKVRAIISELCLRLLKDAARLRMGVNSGVIESRVYIFARKINWFSAPNA